MASLTQIPSLLDNAAMSCTKTLHSASVRSLPPGLANATFIAWKRAGSTCSGSSFLRRPFIMAATFGLTASSFFGRPRCRFLGGSSAAAASLAAASSFNLLFLPGIFKYAQRAHSHTEHRQTLHDTKNENHLIKMVMNTYTHSTSTHITIRHSVCTSTVHPVHS